MDQGHNAHRNVSTSLDRARRKGHWRQSGTGEAAISNPDSKVWKDCSSEATSTSSRKLDPKNVLTELRKVMSWIYLQRSTWCGGGGGPRGRSQRARGHGGELGQHSGMVPPPCYSAPYPATQGVDLQLPAQEGVKGVEYVWERAWDQLPPQCAQHEPVLANKVLRREPEDPVRELWGWGMGHELEKGRECSHLPKAGDRQANPVPLGTMQPSSLRQWGMVGSHGPHPAQLLSMHNRTPVSMTG